MTVFENILVTVEQGDYRKSSAWWPHINKADCIERTEELIRSVGLTDQSFSFASDLTHYEQRCLEIARGLAMDPRILLVDEPADGMNTQQQHAMADLLKEVCEGALTLVVTSSGNDPFALICDRTVHLSPR